MTRTGKIDAKGKYYREDGITMYFHGQQVVHEEVCRTTGGQDMQKYWKGSVLWMRK
jgi:hypothetical protein